MRRVEWFGLALIITFAAHKLPEWLAFVSWPLVPAGIRVVGLANYFYLWTVVFGVVLVVSDPRRYGLRIGDIDQHLIGTTLVCATPIALTAIVYPRLPVRPFSHAAAGMWLISPLAQKLVFTGYLYAKFDELFPDYIHPRVRMRWGLVIVGLYFAAWHLPNLHYMPAGYVVFQLLYTFLGCLCVGLSRQWTGSILYCTMAHMAGNCIAWCS